MVQYSKHAIILFSILASTPSDSEAFSTISSSLRHRSLISCRASQTPRGVSATGGLNFNDEEKAENILDDLSDALQRDEEENALEEKLMELKRTRTRERVENQNRSRTTVALDTSSEQSLGMVVAQVKRGRELVAMGENRFLLNMDTLVYQEFPDAVDIEGLLNERVDASFSGLVVMAVDPEGQAYDQGVRPGDLLVASSATMGTKMWPKTTLDGLLSSVSSRKVVSPVLNLQVQPANDKATIDNRFELELSKPLGIEIGENDVGYVVVTGFNENASKLVRTGIQVGDRIIAVASAMGGSLWPVSTVEGVISACITRFPNQKINMQFERPVENLLRSVSTKEFVTKSTNTAKVALPKLTPMKEKLLLERCQELLRRYQTNDEFLGKRDIPTVVADKVTDAIASASASFDAVTLSMVMNAHNACGNWKKSIELFEGAVGLKADGSIEGAAFKIKGKTTGEVISNPNAVNLYSASALLNAWVKLGDLPTANRVLAALDGSSGKEVEGKSVAIWPGVSTSFVPDAACYNIVLAAVANSGDITEMMNVFNNIGTTDVQVKNGVKKDVTSYNTVISALSKADMHDKAFEIFNDMKSGGIAANKYTYTSLIKSCQSTLDMEELLYEMKEKGISPDIVTYNTMIRTLCDRLKWYDAQKFISDMERSGLKPNALTYGFLMQGLFRARKYSACLTLFESACADSRTAPIMENVYLFTTAISAAAALKNHEKAFDLVGRMTRSGVQPNTKTLTALVKACISASKSDLAVKVYRKIKEPDGRAMVQGLKAMCNEGHFEEVLETLHQQYRTRGSALSGKEVATGFSNLIQQSLRQKDLLTARKSFNKFLSLGYIPSKVLFNDIIESLGLIPVMERNLAFAPEIPEESFDFLLFVMDALRQRNLACDANFYSALLIAGSRIGGLRRRICSLISESRVTKLTQMKETAIMDSSEDHEKRNEIGWGDLLKDYNEYNTDEVNYNLPPVLINVRKNQVRRVLAAESGVAYRSGRR
eukprot:CAMPEP_0178921454 /NCGR_PEP_ID=MMETSP0786-20121207/15570_1 /TAXON_ID=186022 /ORGANISM="Thalassionema frauenfeldii, Strain CCMP 1798" /LENGTH=997 /DNA_ID=CAMNT_0020595635 /DNA_START=288 /DNA_END=3278 /DNA_ORIENTATION=+